MSAFDGLTCKCGHRITAADMKSTWPFPGLPDEGYPMLAEDGFWEYIYVCPDCGRTYWRPRIGDDYSGGW
jgi:DNA-directed RNA polymerase subunit RPC12/RpoP